MTDTCNAVVFTKAGRPLEIRQFELPASVAPGAALCRVRMSAICGSDLHTISGRRIEPAPLILGHEIVGEIVALGAGLERDGFGNKLSVGDRVSWSIMACCGHCFYCTHDLPQKCIDLRKYGHTCCNELPHLTGGYAEYIYLFPGTAIYRIPDTISDEVATPANCALSTVINAVETIGLNKGESVLIQGAGMLGLNLIALAAEQGANEIIVTDMSPSRLELAARFGATCCLNMQDLHDEQALADIHKRTDGRGADVAFEVCGVKSAVAQAVDALRIGGRYLVAGLVTPGSDLGIDGNQLTRKCLTIKGIHNYRPEHLGKAIEFLASFSSKYPYAGLVGAMFPLAGINDALNLAASGKHIRVGLMCRSHADMKSRSYD